MSVSTVIDEPTTNAGVASAIARHAKSYGIDVDPICHALGIVPDDLQSLTARVSLDRVCRLLETCALISNDEAFGLKSADIFIPGSSGAFGYGMSASPTIRHWVQFLSDHTPYISHTSDCRLEHTDSEAIVSWTFSPLIVKRDQYVDMLVAIHMRFLRRMIGADADAVIIGLERPRPQNVGIFRERLSRQVNFDMRMNSMRVPNRLLDLQNPRGDEKLFKLMDIQCRALHAAEAPEEEFFERVRRYVRRRIAEPVLSLDDISSYFKLSERTFQRRLAEAGTTLNEVRDDERRELSLALLTQSDLPVSAICYRLGYSAPSAFTRSVHRWFGASPKVVRERAAGFDTANRPS